jgi:uncharacterized protein YkwD
VYRLAALIVPLLFSIAASTLLNLPAVASNSAVPLASVGVQPLAAVTRDDVLSLEQHLFDLTNTERQQAGLPSLVLDLQLQDVARIRAEAQVDQDRLNHLDANGEVAFGPLLDERGVRYALAGENLARVPGPTGDAPSRADNLLIQSPGHRANILDPRFDRIAIGSAVDAYGNIIFAQLFRTLS